MNAGNTLLLLVGIIFLLLHPVVAHEARNGRRVKYHETIERNVGRNVPDAPSTATISANPSMLTNARGQDCRISWSGVSYPSAYDWIGIYSPSTSSDWDYMDFVWANESLTHYSGYGSFDITLFNLRTDYEFRYWTWSDTYHYQRLAVSNLVKFVGGPNEPLQGHLSLTSKTNEMRVMWSTSDKTVPMVLYGTSPGNYLYSATGTSRTYTAAQMCGAPANITGAQHFRDPGYTHDVLLTNLNYNTVYYYKFGNSADGYSREYSFRSAPALTQKMEKELKFIIYGDMGTPGDGFPASLETIRSVETDILNGDIAFVLHIGDISYAMSAGYIWDMFMLLIEPVATRVPYLISIGNHDYCHMGSKNDPSGAKANGFHPSWGNYGDDSYGECSVPTINRFHMPDNGHGPYWYSYNSGNVHFVVMSTEHNFTYGSDQYVWLENDLRSLNRSVFPWVIFNGHRPPYESENYPGDWQVSLYIRKELEPLFEKYDVNLALWGHYHSFQRTCPVHAGVCKGTYDKPSATVHITVGSAGASLDGVDYYDVPWALFSAYEWGYSRITVFNESTLLHEFVRSQDSIVFDSFYLNNLR